MNALVRTVAARRDFPASRRIPYSAQLTPEILSTKAGDLVQVFRLAGASFESADDETLNNWHERLNVTWRNIASPNVALWSHIVRRRSIAGAEASGAKTFAEQLAGRYQRRLANETLMVNELYLSVVFRPITGAAPSLASQTAIEAARRPLPLPISRIRLMHASNWDKHWRPRWSRYEPERLGVYERGRPTVLRIAGIPRVPRERRIAGRARCHGLRFATSWRQVACSLAAKRSNTGLRPRLGSAPCSASRNTRRRQPSECTTHCFPRPFRSS